MVLGVLFPIAILGLLALGGALLFRRGGDAGGLVTLPVWLIYLGLVVRDARAARALPATTA